MTTYTAIADTEIDADSPITVGLMTKIRDNPIAMSEGASGAPRVVRGQSWTYFSSTNTAWNVPSGVFAVIIEVWGASGGGAGTGATSPTDGSAGGTTTVALKPGGGSPVTQMTVNGADGGKAVGSTGLSAPGAAGGAGSISDFGEIRGGGITGGPSGAHASYTRGQDGVSGTYAIGRLAVDSTAGDQLSITIGAAGAAGSRGSGAGTDGGPGYAARVIVWY